MTKNSERVKKSIKSLLERGGKRLPSGYLQPEDAVKIDSLVKSGYASSHLGVVVCAVRDAYKKISRT
jgi:hypothetical protein